MLRMGLPGTASIDGYKSGRICSDPEHAVLTSHSLTHSTTSHNHSHSPSQPSTTPITTTANMQFSSVAIAIVAFFGAAVVASDTCVYGTTQAECYATCEQGSAPTICKSVRCSGCPSS